MLALTVPLLLPLSARMLNVLEQLHSYQTRIEQSRKLQRLSSEGRVDLWSSRRQWMNSGSLFVKLPGRDIKEIVTAGNMVMVPTINTDFKRVHIDLEVLVGELQRVKELIASKSEELKALDSQIMGAVERQIDIERLEIK